MQFRQWQSIRPPVRAPIAIRPPAQPNSGRTPPSAAQRLGSRAVALPITTASKATEKITIPGQGGGDYSSIPMFTMTASCRCVRISLSSFCEAVRAARPLSRASR